MTPAERAERLAELDRRGSRGQQWRRAYRRELDARRRSACVVAWAMPDIDVGRLRGKAHDTA